MIEIIPQNAYSVQLFIENCGDILIVATQKYSIYNELNNN